MRGVSVDPSTTDIPLNQDDSQNKCRGNKTTYSNQSSYLDQEESRTFEHKSGKFMLINEDSSCSSKQLYQQNTFKSVDPQFMNISENHPESTAKSSHKVSVQSKQDMMRQILHLQKKNTNAQQVQSTPNQP